MEPMRKTERKETNMGNKPGIMLYFEMLPCLQEISDAQMGRLVRAMLAYGETGEEPRLADDPALKMAWPFVRLRLDQDEQRYRRRVTQSRQAALVRWGKRTEHRVYEAGEEESL